MSLAGLAILSVHIWVLPYTKLYINIIEATILAILVVINASCVESTSIYVPEWLISLLILLPYVYTMCYISWAVCSLCWYVETLCMLKLLVMLEYLLCRIKCLKKEVYKLRTFTSKNHSNADTPIDCSLDRSSSNSPPEYISQEATVTHQTGQDTSRGTDHSTNISCRDLTWSSSQSNQYKDMSALREPLLDM